MDRGTRRAQRERMKARAKRIFPNDPEAHKLADHMAFCRNFCCQAHRREFSGPTLREIRFAADDRARAC
jgi:hypothetical protein